MIFGGGGIFGNLALPLVLIGAGIFILFRRNMPAFAGGMTEKPKVDFGYSNGKAKNGVNPAVNSRLQREIDAALAEDDEDAPVV